MRRALRVVLVFATLAIVFGKAPGAWACSCAPFGPEGAIAHADVAFVGVVYQVDDPGDDGSPSPEGRFIRYRLEVEETLKGTLADRVRVGARNQGSLCGYVFRLGHRYRVFADGSRASGYGTNLCSGNEDLGPSGRTIAPDREPDPDPTEPHAPAPSPSEAPSPGPAKTAEPAPTRPSAEGSIDGVAAGAPVAGDGSAGLVAAFGALTVATTAGALIFARRRRA